MQEGGRSFPDGGGKKSMRKANICRATTKNKMERIPLETTIASTSRRIRDKGCVCAWESAKRERANPPPAVSKMVKRREDVISRHNGRTAWRICLTGDTRGEKSAFVIALF